MGNIEVINGGILTTVQDFGRYGHQEIGISVCGVCDDYSARIANALVGNDLNEAVLEMTYFGPTLKFNEDMVIALTGADFNAKLNNEAIETEKSYEVKAGDVLKCGSAKEGMRGYIAFGGVVDVPVVNNSKSTHIKTKMGGFKGRALKAKDELNVIVNKDATKDKILPEEFKLKISKFNILRVVLGPQDDYFTEKGIHTLFTSGGYQVTKDFDRMGIRLKGTKIEHKETADIISDGTALGSIQVPSNGEPIILFVDRQTTGGYTKIGTVITADLYKLANMKFLDKVLFQEVSIEGANKLAIEYYEKFERLKELLK